MLYKLVSVSCFTAALLAAGSGQSGSIVGAKVVLGLEGVADNSVGQLSIEQNALMFTRREEPTVRIPLSAIRGAFLSEEDKQEGGRPMQLGQAAAPFGGGRVIALFSHKKFDFLTLESFDSNGGMHETIYQLNRGQGQALAKAIDSAKQAVEVSNAQ